MNNFNSTESGRASSDWKHFESSTSNRLTIPPRERRLWKPGGRHGPLRQQPFRFLLAILGGGGKAKLLSHTQRKYGQNSLAERYRRGIRHKIIKRLPSRILRKALARRADHPNYIEPPDGAARIRLISPSDWQRVPTTSRSGNLTANRAKPRNSPSKSTGPNSEGDEKHPSASTKHSGAKLPRMGCWRPRHFGCRRLHWLWRHFRKCKTHRQIPKTSHASVARMPFFWRISRANLRINKEYLAGLPYRRDEFSELGRL